MRAVYVVTMPQQEFAPIIAFEGEHDAEEFARSMHSNASGDFWKNDIHKVCYVPMSFTDTLGKELDALFEEGER